MKRITKLVAAAFGAVAMFTGSARAEDVTLTKDEVWTDGRTLSGTIDLNGHKLTVSSLTGNATITSPAGYEILEYIDSDSKAYVDTGVKAAYNTVVDIKFRMLQNLGGNFVSFAGARPQNGVDSQFACFIQNLKFYWCVQKNEGFNGTIELNKDYTVHLAKNGPCKINDSETTYATGSGVGNDATIFVFGANQNGAAAKGYFRVYSCRIAHGDAVQCDLKPARRLSDGALGLLDVKDKANLVFKENKDSSGAFTAGPVVSDEFVKQPGELHVKVASGSAENSSVAITEAVRVVKEGAGTFVAMKQGQTYNGGTDVAGGTFRCGADGQSGIYGANGSSVTVREGAIFDCDGYANHTQFPFVLDGGTLKSATNRGKSSNSWFANVTLTKNSYMSGDEYGFVGGSWAEGILRMNDCTLTVDVTGGKNFYMGNLKVEGGGEIYVRSGGWFALGGNPGGGKYVKAETTTLRMGGAAIRDAGGAHEFGSYVSEYTAGYDQAYTVIKVRDNFKPGTLWHATELQNGATLDLSGYAGTWNTACRFTSPSAEAKATFVDGATISIALGERQLENGMKLIGWTDTTAPSSTVKFKLPDEVGDDFMLVRNSDGLYVTAAVKTATWTGAADTVCTNPENWDCFDANGKKIADALPGSITAVTLTGEVQLDILANSFSCASFACDNVSLKGDCNWSGLGQGMSGVIDLAGHDLTVSSLTGDATITNSVASGYEILDYIDSDGKAYVDTGVKTAYNTVIDIKMRMWKISSEVFVSYAGSRVTNKSDDQFAGYVNRSDSKHYWAVSKNEGWGGSIALNTDYQIHLDKNGPCKINGTTYAPYATGSGVGNNLTIALFGANQTDGVASRGYFRVYSCRIAYGDDLQCDLKPARRLSDGALGLLDVKDKANLAFKENGDSSGAFTAGPVVSGEFVKEPGELHVAVASGSTENSTITISGPVRVVKEGAGTFIATKQKQTYSGGTDVAGGTFRCGADGQSGIYGANGCSVTVREGAIFDLDGWANHTQFPFVLDGGTLTVGATDRGKSSNSWISDVTLTKNSYMTGGNYGFVGSSWGEGILRMNGCTLTVDVTSGKDFYMGNLKVEGGGEIYAKTGGWLALGGNPGGGKYVRAETTTLRIRGAAIKDGGGEYVFGSYISEYTGGHDGKNKAIKVLECFKPSGERWHATELQDGATLDLSDCAGTWNSTCNFPSSAVNATATFAAGATIFVDLGVRKVKSSEPIVTWSAKPENVKFRAVPGAKGKFTVKDNGLYWNIGFGIIIR